MDNNKFLERWKFVNLIFIVLCVIFLVACDEAATPTSIPFAKITPQSTKTTSNSTDSPSTTLPANITTNIETSNISGVNDTSSNSPVATPTPPTQLIGPTVGSNGQITVNAPPADGKSVSGRFYWIKSGGGTEIWTGGVGVGKPLSTQAMGGQNMLTVPDNALAKDPMLSPDGKELAYSYSPPPYTDAKGNIIFGADIFVMDVSTKKTQMLVKRNQPEEFLEFPYWSVDSQQIYFASRTPHREGDRVTGTDLAIAVYDLKTQQRRDLAKDASEPVPLPDGKSLIYIGIAASDDSYAQTLQILDLTSGKAKELESETQNFYGFRAPRPAPDGKIIAFGAIGGPDEVPIGTPPVAGVAATPTVKKSGSLLNILSLFGLIGGIGNKQSLTGPPALPSLHGLPYDVWEIMPDGSGLRRLTSLFEDEPIVAWSKDGSNIIFLAGNGFYGMNADGSNLTKKSNEGAHGGFTWQP